ncbi:MAG TPA: glucose 1-dehydrogenase [Limnochordia bacterium]
MPNDVHGSDSRKKVFDQLRLDGKVAFITGGSRGLGKEIGLAFAEAGARIAVAGRDGAAAEKAAADIARQTGADALGLVCDVTQPEMVQAALGRILDRFGRIDILVNSAGVNVRKPIQEFTDAEWRRVIDTNLTGPFYCCRAVAEHMIRQQSGRVINLGSMMGQVALPGRVAYCASKGGLHMLTKVLALEWAPHHITVNAICPGPFMTELNEPVLENPEMNRFFLERIPLGRWGQPPEIGALALYLASDAARFVTGATFYIDGGWTAQ